MFENFKADVTRWRKTEGGFRKGDLYLLFEQGIWAVAVYRFGRWVRTVDLPVVSLILKLLAFVLFKLMEIVTGISLPASAEIGKGFYAGHFGPMILHSRVKMGENCSIGPGVVIGTRGQGNEGVPVIGNDVYIGVGAKVLGGITLGHHVRVGANAVVLKNVPDRATVAGIPAKVIRIAEE